MVFLVTVFAKTLAIIFLKHFSRIEHISLFWYFYVCQHQKSKKKEGTF